MNQWVSGRCHLQPEAQGETLIVSGQTFAHFWVIHIESARSQEKNSRNILLMFRLTVPLFR